MTDDRTPELWELWARPAKPSPLHLHRWTLPRLILDAGRGQPIPDEEVATWPVLDHRVTLSELVAESRRLPESTQ